ncbi:MAG: hypothetical protein OIF48_20705 [Silicimonas sp.]|nr:hypothetical protein [Silicimonas sp.]
MAAPPPDIPRNPGINRVWAVFLAVFGAISLFVAGLLATTNGIPLWVGALPAGLAIGLFLLAWRVYLRPSKSGAALTFEKDALTLDITSALHAPRHYRIGWADLREIHLVKGGYGAGGLGFLLTHEAAQRLGLIQPTTRAAAPDLLVGRNIATPRHSFALPDEQVVARLTEAAETVGYQVTRKTHREFLVVGKTVFEVARKEDM